MVVSIRHIKQMRICKQCVQCVFARVQCFKNFWPRSDNEESMIKVSLRILSRKVL